MSDPFKDITVWIDVMSELRAVTTSHEEAIALARQAVLIGQHGGISDEKLQALLYFAAVGSLTPIVRRLLRDAGIDPDPADAIVIERSEIPQVDWDEEHEWFSSLGGKFIRGYFETQNDPASVAHRMALEYLAIAEYYRAHPPVDEAQVEALAAEIRAVHPYSTPSDEIASYLIRNGWKKEPRP
ncbi:hypothetical protein [Cellulomonas denverensis]|uniref:Uncharacterized protein n=1 Tax=Cellulomonas denverensis TaxID=264297 RepID=A0A7X6KTU4_9CELL|nr:hypothetical protein [Cellulomonas denverensis]NKY22182.1 hypothetical protein [Cellulomonas denverensis]GIG27145.1 hypothetical protein Cde04nite_33890 [Cellulomonas denverensis]